MQEHSNGLSLAERARLKVSALLTQTLLRRPLDIDPPRGLVSFSFDDFPASAWRVGGPILRRHGVRGTYYAAFGLMGGESEGQAMMTPDDIAALRAEGHELGCHTYSHISCRGLDRGRLARELDANSVAFAKLKGPNGSGPHAGHQGGQTDWDCFSYPFGNITLTAKKLASGRFTTCRGRQGGLNSGSIDLAALRSDSLYSRFDPVERTLAQIEEAARRRGWLIFCSHDVSEVPSPYGCTPEHLEAAVAAAVAAGCDVVTVGEAARRLGARGAKETD